MKKQIGVVGASGYTGAELLRLLALHPDFDVTNVTAHSQAGKSVSAIHPHLAGIYPQLVTETFDQALGSLLGCDCVFVALPHGESLSVIPLLEKAKRVIDLGGDFRLRKPESYQRWYGAPHTAPQLLESFVYGLPELNREQLCGATRIANPGCYPTAVSVGVSPLLSHKLVAPTVIASCVSGTSGAGKSLKENMHFSSADENVYSYRVGSHQHTPEIEQALTSVAEVPVRVNFIPHVAPMTRGIHATCVLNLHDGVSPETVRDAYRESYEHEAFISLLNYPPNTKEVRGTNRVALHVVVDQRLNQVVVTSVIDNLVKGAAGQAIQNANICFGYPETRGLELSAFYP
ncbi:MAG: N-acetyl-gamma-glutamyl-phosphate reductase [Bdellovibrionales bacterium]|nr:N-acetyl-gamma-glutamyl-phosphate reductase [Bdellovibrionales bacterium]